LPCNGYRVTRNDCKMGNVILLKGNTMCRFVTDLWAWLDYQSMEIIFNLFGNQIGL